MNIATIFFSICTAFVPFTGDTVALTCQESPVTSQVEFVLKLRGIKAPHLEQPWGKEAAYFLYRSCQNRVQALVEDMPVNNEYTGTLICDTGTMSEQMVVSGMAWATTPMYSPDMPKDATDKEKYFDSLHKFEEAARQMKIGIWSDPNPIHPDDWIKQQPKNKSKKKAIKQT